MTALQIEYWRNRETERHNRELERQGQQTIKETTRHNFEQEAIGRSQAAAAHAQAAVARYRASIDASYLSLAQAKQPYEISKIQADTYLTRAQGASTYANTRLTESKTRRQEAENSVYAQYGAKQAQWNYYNTIVTTASTGIKAVDTAITGLTKLIKGTENSLYSELVS